jgi:hypothetical protein
VGVEYSVSPANQRIQPIWRAAVCVKCGQSLGDRVGCIYSIFLQILRVCDEPLEACEIEALGIDAEHVAGRLEAEALGAG